MHTTHSFHMLLEHDVFSTGCRKNEVARLFVDGMTSQKRFVGKCLPDNYMDGFDDFIQICANADHRGDVQL
jgi:hypothetical protein